MRNLWVLALSLLAGCSCGGGSGEPDAGASPPTLTARTPVRDATNVWFFDPVVLVFSEELAPETIPGSVTVTAAGGDLEATATLGEDGRTVTVTLGALPPMLPAPANIAVSADITDLDGEHFGGEAWAYDLPVWQQPASSPIQSTPAAGDAIAIDGGPDGPVVAWREGSSTQVRRLEGASWVALPSLATGASPVAPTLAHDFNGRLRVAWVATDPDNSIHVSAWFDASWSELGAGIDAGVQPVLSPPRMVQDGAALWVAWLSADGVELRAWNASAEQWGTEPMLARPGAQGFAAAVVDGALNVAYVDASGDLRLAVQADGGVWTESGTALQHDPLADARDPELLGGSAGGYLAWIESDNLHVADLGGSFTSGLGGALDLDIAARVDGARLAVTSDGVLHAAWGEHNRAGRRGHVARWRAGRWEHLGPAVNAGAGLEVTLPFLALHRDQPTVLFATEALNALHVRRYNGSREPPFGLLAGAGYAPGCVIPEDDDNDFPQTLTETGCYQDVPGRVIVAGAIPFELNTPLWSDGAAKQRYLVLPAGETLGYTDTGAFTAPAGTILIKEFLLEDGAPDAIIPMETRFLVKRCDDGLGSCTDPWQGYSYQWNDAGTEATLLDGTAVEYKDWIATSSGSSAPHTHTYPSRPQCVRCHNLAAGRVLGLQAGQLDRPNDYGDAIDNQLRALVNAAVLTGTGNAATPFPRPPDASTSLESRVRSYAHSNCAHCHRAGGEQLTIDFRWEVGLAATGMCAGVMPGQPRASSTLYLKDAATPAAPPPTGLPMPPIAKLTADTAQLDILGRWIEGLSSCP